jgi:crotonobetainyl-CoA:carnitine CoA-transferase CaiB-like acyl-CoA transferase
VIVDNFRAGQLERIGYGDDYLRAIKPEVVVCHISSYGQHGPHCDPSSSSVIGEAIGRLHCLIDNPEGTNDLPPVRVGVSTGDSLPRLSAAIGILAALLEKRPPGISVDVALTVSVLSLLKGTLPEFGMFGSIHKSRGDRIPALRPATPSAQLTLAGSSLQPVPTSRSKGFAA